MKANLYLFIFLLLFSLYNSQDTITFSQESGFYPNDFTLTLTSSDNSKIFYTTDGSDPKENGGLYTGEFVVPRLCKYVLALSLYKDEIIDSIQISIDQDSKAAAKKEIDIDKPLSYVFKKKKQFQ